MHCMTELLISHPEFNFTENIIQFSVPYLNNANLELRSIVKNGLDRLFKNDKKGQVSYLGNLSSFLNMCPKKKTERFNATT